MRPTIPTEINPLEGMLAAIELSPWSEIYRTAVGFATIPLFTLVWDASGSSWALIPFLVLILFLTRVLPAAARVVIPFSHKVKHFWAERRRIAKRYDSYQWQKLFWIGAGLALYTALPGRFTLTRAVVAGACLVSGFLGQLAWRAVRIHAGATGAAARQ